MLTFIKPSSKKLKFPNNTVKTFKNTVTLHLTVGQKISNDTIFVFKKESRLLSFICIVGRFFLDLIIRERN